MTPKLKKKILTELENDVAFRHELINILIKDLQKTIFINTDKSFEHSFITNVDVDITFNEFSDEYTLNEVRKSIKTLIYESVRQFECLFSVKKFTSRVSTTKEFYSLMDKIVCKDDFALAKNDIDSFIASVKKLTHYYPHMTAKEVLIHYENKNSF